MQRPQDVTASGEPIPVVSTTKGGAPVTAAETVTTPTAVLVPSGGASPATTPATPSSLLSAPTETAETAEKAPTAATTTKAEAAEGQEVGSGASGLAGVKHAFVAAAEKRGLKVRRKKERER